MRLAGNKRWNLQYRMVTSCDIGDRTNATQARAIFARALATASGGRVRLSQLGGNPTFQVIRVEGLLGTCQSNHRASVTVESDAEFDTSIVDRAYAEAVKGAGNPGFSVERLVQKLPNGSGCNAVDTFGLLQRGGAIHRICRDQSEVSSGATTAVPPETTFADSVVSTSGSASVQSSTNPAEVGQVVQTLRDRVRSGPSSLWTEIPGDYKIVAGVVAGLAVLVLGAYALRSVAIIKAAS